MPGRDSQIQHFALCFSPAVLKKKLARGWLFGRPGTRNRLIAKFMLRKIEREASVRGAYVNCWENNSYYSGLDWLVRDLRMLGAEKLNACPKLERLMLYMGKSPFIIVLDEID